MMMTDLFIYIIGGLTVISAIYILFTDNILYAAFSLVVTLMSIAILYFLAGAEFVGVTQIMIYVGGIIVLIIFGVMLTNEQRSKAPTSGTHNKFMAFILAAGLFVALLYAILRINFSDVTLASHSSIKKIGVSLMNEYILPFELAAVLLLLVLIGATVIAGKNKHTS